MLQHLWTTPSTGGGAVSDRVDEYNEQHKLAASTTASRWDRRQAERRRADARNQLTLLRNDDSESGSTDFYSYRYLASEGFCRGIHSRGCLWRLISRPAAAPGTTATTCNGRGSSRSASLGRMH